MAIITLEDLRGHLDIDITSDNPLLQEAIDDAQSYIESQTNRVFEAETDTRYYDSSAINRWNSRQLDLLKDDLLTITTLTNGDSAGTAIANTEYWLTPRNEGPPYHGILLKTDISDYWQWDVDYWVSVAGTWGYSTTAPADIRRAMLHLSAFFFRQKDAQVFDVTAIPEAGVITIPTGIPATVTRILERYKRYL